MIIVQVLSTVDIEIEFDFRSLGKCACGGKRVLRAKMYGEKLGSWIISCSECSYRFQIPVGVRYKKYEQLALNKFRREKMGDLADSVKKSFLAKNPENE
jgi:hypothetical protein